MTPTRLVVLAASAAAGTVLLAACGSSGTSGAPTPTAASSAAAGAPSGSASGGGFGPAASGVIAAIAGKTLQVQNATEQNAVTYSSSTRFTEQQKTSLSAIKVGTCITATSASSTPSASPSSSPAGRPTHITATRIDVVGTGSSCGFGNRTPGISGIPSRPAGSVPSGMPSGMPSGRAGFRGGFADRVAGKVTRVSGTTITVRGFSGPGITSTTSRTVTVTPSTVYSGTAAATAKALKIGLCAVVQGSTDSTGAVAARSIALSPKTNGACKTGFGFGGFRPGRSGTGG